jgi:biotin carboxyl carrier protein
MDEAHVVPAGVIGTIADVCVGNGDFVEFGQPLFKIELKREAAE